MIGDRRQARRSAGCGAADQSIKSIGKECWIARATVRDILGRGGGGEKPIKNLCRFPLKPWVYLSSAVRLPEGWL
jgi:hypothetical protein